MKKVYKLRDLDCANCAAKMESAINKLPQVDAATVSFFTQNRDLRRGGGRGGSLGADQEGHSPR